jgi:hypothetical protein
MQHLIVIDFLWDIGVKALLYGLPISVVVMVLICWSLSSTFEYGFALPLLSIIFVIAAIFIIISSAMFNWRIKARKYIGVSKYKTLKLPF